MAERDEKVVQQKRQSRGKNKGNKDKGVTEKGDQVVESKSTVVEDKTKQGNSSVVKDNQNKMDKVDSVAKKTTEKSREEILAEREAKRLAKAQKKKGKDGNVDKGNKQQSDVKKVDVGKENQGVATKVEQLPDKSDKPRNDSSQTKDSKETESGDKGKEEGKSKAQLRAERRALQEAQRAKKLEKAKEVHEEKSSPVVEVPKQEKTTPKVIKAAPATQDKIHKVKLFAHLYRDVFDCVDMDLAENIHPSIIRLGTQYRSKVISGANARCLALLNAFKTVVNDYKTLPNQEFSRGLEAEISKSISFLNKCRPVAVSMKNAVKHLKFQVNQIKSGNEVESKKLINEWIDTYIKEQIEKAAEAISLFVLEKITDGDVILTYSWYLWKLGRMMCGEEYKEKGTREVPVYVKGCSLIGEELELVFISHHNIISFISSLIQRALIKAYKANIKFRVVVVDGRPWLEGKEMLRRLVKAGISCTYVFFNGLSFIMPEVTKILLGAHALLANGYVMSRAGSSQIALLAKTYNVPVLVCCETHKFSEKVQTDSFVHNELGDPDKLISGKNSSSTELSNWRTMQYLTPLNLTYDVTPPDLVSAVVTEIAVLPCTSVPVILRVKPPDLT